MRAQSVRLCISFSVAVFFIGAASPAMALANRVFVSARSGNDANSCDNVTTPCRTFAGAVLQLNPDGEVIVLDSGGYGPVTITQGITIEAPAGVTAFIHPPSGDAITVNAGSGSVTLRGLTLNVGTGSGILVNSVGTLNVENSFITGFANSGIKMLAGNGVLNVKGTDIKGCGWGIYVSNSGGVTSTMIDHCHLDGNSRGFFAWAQSPGTSRTSATYTTANNNTDGWTCGSFNSGKDVLDLEFCTGSGNSGDGLFSHSASAQSAVRYSNCVFVNNEIYGVENSGAGTVSSRGNNTITGNGTLPTSGTIGSFSPM